MEDRGSIACSRREMITMYPHSFEVVFQSGKKEEYIAKQEFARSLPNDLVSTSEDTDALRGLLTCSFM